MNKTLTIINKNIQHCQLCPDLRQYCAEIGKTKRKAYSQWNYWAKPVPGFGDISDNTWLWIVGLAPAAHGANRTGRMFTGDRSGDFLYAGLHQAGLANQPESVSRDDALKLAGVYISAALHCAPPGNKPAAAQLDTCRQYLIAEYHALKNVKVILALGGIAWNSVIKMAEVVGYNIATPRPKFGHGARIILDNNQKIVLLGCYHVSQQNTFTGRLTPAMLQDILQLAKSLS